MWPTNPPHFWWRRERKSLDHCLGKQNNWIPAPYLTQHITSCQNSLLPGLVTFQSSKRDFVWLADRWDRFRLCRVFWHRGSGVRHVPEAFTWQGLVDWTGMKIPHWSFVFFVGHCWYNRIALCFAQVILLDSTEMWICIWLKSMMWNRWTHNPLQTIRS